MGRKKKVEEVAEQELIPGAELEVVDDITKPIVETGQVVDDTVIPDMTDITWPDYVMSQFKPEELLDGNPTVAGLRRVTELLLGPIIVSDATVVQAPNLSNDYTATVKHSITILWSNYTDDHIDGTERHFSEVADVSPNNCDAEYARFASSTASTRAEGRALRKALKLQRVIAAEEKTTVPVTDQDNGFITETQIQFIDMLCERTNINVLKYINCGENRYSDIRLIGGATAKKMVKFLSECQRDKSNIPSDIVGYESDWQERKG